MLRSFVNSLSYPIKQGAKYIYGAIPPRFRYGKAFWDTYNFLQESQWWSKEKLEEYQMKQLKKLLQHAYENVPYYRRIFDERGLKPKDIQDFDDLKKLPYLTKKDVKNNFNDLVAKNFSKPMFRYVSTSGSTGIPLQFYEENKVTNAREMAFHWRMRGWIGYRFTDKCAVLRGNVVKRFERNKRAWWEYTPVDNLLILSVYEMIEENLFKYVKKLNEFQPEFIQAYPSGITILARFIKEHDIELIYPIKAILCGSETLYSSQREMIEETFKCRVFSWYGHTEQNVLAGECEKSTYYHIFPEYGVTELIRSDGSPANLEGGAGEIVGTGFNNYVMPFIRYKTGDLAVYTPRKCSCGRNYKLIEKVEGRLQEFIVAKDGHLIPLGDMQIFFVFDNVKQFQFYQDKEGEVVFKIVKEDTYNEEDTSYILKNLYDRIGSSVKVYIEFVDKIPRTSGGKYRFLTQKLPINFGGVEKQNE